MGEPWYADSPKQFLYNFWQNHGLGRPVFESLSAQHGMLYCRVAMPPAVVARQSQLSRELVAAPGYCGGYGRNKKDAETAAARNGCDQLAALGLLTRGKKSAPLPLGNANMTPVGPGTAAAGPGHMANGAGMLPLPSPAVSAMPPPQVAIVPPYLQRGGHHRGQQRPGTLPFNPAEPYLSNPKSNFAHCWQIRGYGPPQYIQPPPTPYSQGMFESAVQLPHDVLQRVKDLIASGRCDPALVGPLTHVANTGRVSGAARNKKDSSIAAAIQGCALLTALGLMTYPGQPTPAGASAQQGGAGAGSDPPPLHYRLPTPHQKGDFKCEKTHDIDPDHFALTNEEHRNLTALLADITAARNAGQLDMGSLAAPEIFREKQGHNERPSFFFQAMSAEEVTLSNAMSTERQQYTARILPTQRLLWGSEDIIGMRAKLPIYDQRQHIIDTINGHQVCVLSGETGCGKSTQVPQYLLESLTDMGMGSRAKIIVTQPRRISAISVAERVAFERAETLGKSVGYRIRLEGVPSRPRGSILFCTTGIVLRMLLDDNALSDVSHLIVDEVHERDLLSDFLLIVLRDLLPRRPHLRVVLMSATINADLFSDYFAKHGFACPTIAVPGFTHPVEHMFLEDVLMACPQFDAGPHIMAAKLAESSAQRFNSRNQRSLRPDKLVLQAPVNGPETTLKESEAAEIGRTFGQRMLKNIRELEGGLLPLQLVAETVLMIMRTRNEEGAILVFLPGWEEISTASKLLEETLASAGFRMGTYIIHSLHSQLPSLNQKAVFNRPPPGVRKIVLSTNIAETSVTIDDVVFVIDSGRQKEKSYNSTMGIQMLQLSWTSQAAVRQRKGRAGRVRPGVCYTLISRSRFAALLPDSVPEILRVPLEDVALQIKVLGLRGGGARAVLADALQPPTMSMINDALSVLVAMGALERDTNMIAATVADLDRQEKLTPLGKVMARLPLDVRLAKMLLWAVLLRCADPLLTITAALSMRSPFVTPMGPQREAADAARRAFAGPWRSDHVALLQAFEGWKQARAQGWGDQYCDLNYLSFSTLSTIDRLRGQYEQLLQNEGFPVTATANMYSHSIPLVKAVIYSCVFPNVVSVRSGDGATKAKFLGPNNCSLKPHPRSVCSGEASFATQWCAYMEKVKATQLVYCDGVSMISSAALLLLGDAPLDLQVDDLGYVAPGQQPRKRNALVVGGWMVVELPSYEEVLTVQAFHRSLHDMLMHCVATTGHGYDEAIANHVLETMAQLVHRSETKCPLPPPPASSAPSPTAGVLSWRQAPGSSLLGQYQHRHSPSPSPSPAPSPGLLPSPAAADTVGTGHVKRSRWDSASGDSPPEKRVHS